MSKFSTKYFIKIDNLPSGKEKQSVIYLYKPLIGCQAFSLYQFLLNEVDFIKQTQVTVLPFSRLHQFLNLEIEELEEAVQKLVKYQLLDLQKNNQDYFFIFKKPLLFLAFSKSTFFAQYRQLIGSENLESVYFYLTRKKEKSVPESTSSLLPFLKNLQCLENYNWKLKDLQLLTDLYQNHQISLPIIKTVLEFTSFKTGTFRSNYLIKVFTTLKTLGIVHDLVKVKSYFCKLYQEMNLKDVLQMKTHIIPQWLQQNQTNITFPEDTVNIAQNSNHLTRQEFEDSF